MDLLINSSTHKISANYFCCAESSELSLPCSLLTLTFSYLSQEEVEEIGKMKTPLSLPAARLREREIVHLNSAGKFFKNILEIQFTPLTSFDLYLKSFESYSYVAGRIEMIKESLLNALKKVSLERLLMVESAAAAGPFKKIFELAKIYIQVDRASKVENLGLRRKRLEVCLRILQSMGEHKKVCEVKEMLKACTARVPRVQAAIPYSSLTYSGRLGIHIL
jgi:hypothetical protein